MRTAAKAAKYQEILLTLDNITSQDFRMLIPLGFQFEADVLRCVYKKQRMPLVTVDHVISAFERTINTPPFNTSRK